MRAPPVHMPFFYSLLFFVISSSGGGQPDASEQAMYRALLSEAYAGKWLPLSNKALPYDGFVQNKGKHFLRGSQEPYTGWYAQFDDKETPRMLTSFFEGVREGPVVHWNANGDMVMNGAYLQGKKHGVFNAWNDTGVRISEKGYLFGKLDGWSYFWYDSGSIRLRLYFEQGKIVEGTGWLPGGEVCPHTKVEKGSGVIIHHEESIVLPLSIQEEVNTKSSKY